jgi:hypothetical protein
MPYFVVHKPTSLGLKNNNKKRKKEKRSLVASHLNYFWNQYIIFKIEETVEKNVNYAPYKLHLST